MSTDHFIVYGFAPECQSPLIWGHDSSQCHGTQESAKSSMLSGITMTFRTLFLRFDVPAPLGVAVGSASRRPWGTRLFSIIMCRHPPRSEVCEGTRDDNLKRPSAAVPPLCSGTVPVRQHREAHPDPSRRDHRTHAAYPQPSSAAVSTAARQGRVNLTPRCIILTCSQLQKWRQTHIVHCSPLAVPSHFNGFAGIRLAGKRPVSTEAGRKQPSDTNG